MTVENEPPGSSPRANGARRAVTDNPPPNSSAPRRVATPHQGFGYVAVWTILGTLLPGLGLWRAGRRVAGGLIMAVWLGLLGTLGYFAVTNRTLLASLAVNPQVLTWGAVALLALAVLWVVVIGTTHVALRPRPATLGQRFAGSALVGALALAVATPMALGANLAYTSADFLTSVFADDSGDHSATLPTIEAVDPWANKPRLNVLVLGGDSGTNRDVSLGVRTDTVILASIDTHTGATTLFSLPRNTARMPFPADSPLADYYPYGFYDGANAANAEYFLNAMYRNVPNRVPKDALGKTRNFSADVMKLSVGEALGLKVDYYVLVNMDGFKDFINALGGITLNVNYRIPIGGQTDKGIPPEEWIEVGPDQHMYGRKALWYARGRWGLDDYNRMERQRCVINAVVQQAQPTTVLANYQAIAAAGEKTIITDIPRSVLPNLLEVADKVRRTTLRSVVFKPGVAGFYSANPDWDSVRKRVKAALKETQKGVDGTTATPTPTASGTPSPSASSTKKATASPSATRTRSDDLDDICGYHPVDE